MKGGMPRHFWQRGSSAFGILFVIILIIILILMFDMGFVLFSACGDSDDMIGCAIAMLTEPDEEPAPEGSVTATGVISGEYGGENRSVTVSMTFPLEGGAVTGNFSGDCDGTVKGTFAGGNGGAISGTGKGSCAFILPASGSFSGSVNTSSKTVPVHGSGSVPGFSGEGDLTLTY